MKKTYTFFVFIFGFLCYINCFAQKEANNWYFGYNAGITFNTPDGSPVALLYGALHTDEGVATISDKDGNLLFYTDGITIWNRKHEQMQNGKDLMGSPTSTQSAVIIPMPCSNNLYYTFTVDYIHYDTAATHDIITNGFRYSIDR